MNKQQRELLSKLVSTLEDVRASIEETQNDEEEKASNLPDGERQDRMNEAAGYLSDAAGSIGDAIDAITNACDL